MLAHAVCRTRGDAVEPARRLTVGAAAIRCNCPQEPCLDLGVMQPGELRCCRVVLRNRGLLQMWVRVDATGLPHTTATFRETTLPPGVPRVVELSFQFPEEMEVEGELRVHTRTRQVRRRLVVPDLVGGSCPRTAGRGLPLASPHHPQEGSFEQVTCVPLYAHVCDPSSPLAAAAAHSRRVPTARSERAALAAKAAASLLSRSGQSLLPSRASSARFSAAASLRRQGSAEASSLQTPGRGSCALPADGAGSGRMLALGSPRGSASLARLHGAMSQSGPLQLASPRAAGQAPRVPVLAPS